MSAETPLSDEQLEMIDGFETRASKRLAELGGPLVEGEVDLEE